MLARLGAPGSILPVSVFAKNKMRLRVFQQREVILQTALNYQEFFFFFFLPFNS